MDAQDFVKAYNAELKGLEGPDKATINMLTMLAEDNKQHAQAIVDCIEQHLRECKPQGRLPALYLMDSIIKNVREPYKSLFSNNIDKVFGRVWDSTISSGRERLAKLCKLWDGFLAPDVLARVRARMTTISTGQQAPAAVPVLQQYLRPQPQQASAPPQHMQQHQQPAPAQQAPVLQVAHPQQQVYQQPQMLPAGMQPVPAQFTGGHIVLAPGQQLVGPGGYPVMSLPPQPQPAQGTVFVLGPQGQLVPVAQPQPQLIPMQQQLQAIPQHMVGGLPPVSPAHPGWQPQQQQQQQLVRPMQPPQQQQVVPAGSAPMMRRSPAYPASPAVVQASPHHTTSRSPHHRSGTSPHHTSAPGSSVRSGSPSEAAQALQASLDTLLQGLTKTGYLNDPALKATTFDPAFIKTEHKGVIALLKSASDKTRSRFKDIQFQRNKRRKAAAASTSLNGRSWYLTVNSWITGTTAPQEDAEEAVAEVEEDEGPAPPPTVDADPTQTKCAISHEPFDSFYDQDRETWVYRGVMRLQGQEAERHGVPDGSIVKVECLAEADLGSSAAAMAAAAAAGEDEADLAAAALAAPEAGQQQQQVAALAGVVPDPAAAAVDQKPGMLAHVKMEPQEQAGGADQKFDPAAAAAAAGAPVKQQFDENSHPAAAAAAGLKREAAADGEQEGTPIKKPRVSPEP